MNVKDELERAAGIGNGVRLNDIELDPLTVKAMMINEVVPADPQQDFYGPADADYLKTAIPLLQKAGAAVDSMEDVLRMGVYLTNAVKTPKAGCSVEKSAIENSLPYLEAELSLFPNLKVVDRKSVV